MPSSDERIKANRENAQHSTGPQTEEGKKISSLNAIRNGFYSLVDVLPHEDMLAFQGLNKELEQTWKPKTPYELRLVKKMASQEWRLQRCASLENCMFALGHAELGHKVFDPDDAAIHAALTAARSFMQNPRALESLSRHEFRIHRIAQSTLKELQQVQAARQERERMDLVRAANLYKTAKMKGLLYNPADDGFVLTNEKIEKYIARTGRREEAGIAEKWGFNLKSFNKATAA
jgi:hypothetical protein